MTCICYTKIDIPTRRDASSSTIIDKFSIVNSYFVIADILSLKLFSDWQHIPTSTENTSVDSTVIFGGYMVFTTITSD